MGEFVVKVRNYYRPELFKFMPEDLFDILDEAAFYKWDVVVVPEYLINIFYQNKWKVETKGSDLLDYIAFFDN